MSKIYIDEEVFTWFPKTDDGYYGNQNGWSRPYEYLDLAYGIIQSDKDRFHLIDCISNLKRAIDHRIKMLSVNYQFKKLNKLNLPKENLQKLEEFNIIKPAILKTITSIRNIIEHQYKDPPSRKRCSELSDFTWYFLKSTDERCRNTPLSFVLNQNYVSGYDSEYWISFSLGKKEMWEQYEVISVLKRSHILVGMDTGIPINTFMVSLHSNRKVVFSVESDEFRKLNRNTKLSVAGDYDIDPQFGPKFVKLYFAADGHL